MSRAGSYSGVSPYGATGTSKPVPMKLFATWEVDRTPSNCIPRLCSLTLSRLVVLKPLGSDLASISIAVKMQSSKRTLRSNELTLPTNGLLDTGLEMTFSLQYPHFLKRDGNRLQVLLQRRKRYKNRTMLGFKTLAEGIIRMDQVLQKQMDLELELVANIGAKDKCSDVQTVAKLSVLQLSSTPVDQDQKLTTSILAERGYSDDEEEGEFSSGEEEGPDMSDSEPIRSKLPHTRHNFKQRFVSLLRRFRAADTEGSRAALGATSDIQALFNELDSLSCDEDSAGDQEDTMSISSTPKPSLRPFFSSSRSLLDSQMPTEVASTDRQADEKEKNYSGSDGNPDVCWTDPEGQSDPQTNSPPRGDKEGERKSRLFRTGQSSAVNKKKNSLSISTEPPKVNEQPSTPNAATDSTAPRKSFLAMMGRVLPLEETSLPECLALVDSIIGNPLAQRLTQLPGLRVLQPATPSECRAAFQTLLNKFHKFCISNAKPPNVVRVLIAGGDVLTAACLRHFVELLSGRPPEWQNFLRFYIVPIGTNTVARQLSLSDSSYAALFSAEMGAAERGLDDLMSRIQRYFSAPSPPTINLPLAEAMLTCHDESSQIFIPFINEVRIGSTESSSSISVEIDEATGTNGHGGQSMITGAIISSALTSSSPPAPPLTPPSSPNVQVRELAWEPLELQLDYWQVLKGPDSGKNRPDGKNSLKGVFRCIQVCRLPGSQYFNLSVSYASKEKKQKIMRLGKKKEKDRDTEGRSQTVDGVCRLICSAKASHSSPLRVCIDGAEWSGVKFFQLSSTWQTHVKQLNVALIGAPLADSELT